MPPRLQDSKNQDKDSKIMHRSFCCASPKIIRWVALNITVLWITIGIGLCGDLEVCFQRKNSALLFLKKIQERAELSDNRSISS